MLDGLALSMKVGKRAGSDGLCLVRQSLARLETLRASVKAIGTGEKLLALFQMDV